MMAFDGERLGEQMKMRRERGRRGEGDVGEGAKVGGFVMKPKGKRRIRSAGNSQRNRFLDKKATRKGKMKIWRIRVPWVIERGRFLFEGISSHT